MHHTKYPGEPRKIYLYMLIIPGTLFPVFMFSLIAFGVGASAHNDDEQAGPASFLLLGLVFLYTIFLDMILISVIVVTVWTWSKIHDNIHVRGELILQGFMLWVMHFIQVLLYFWDEGDGGYEQYDQIIYFGYFVTVSIGCFISIIIGTQYVRFRVVRKERMKLVKTPSILRMGTRSMNRKKSLRDSLRKRQTSLALKDFDRSQIDFQALIATNHGLQAFMAHLAKGAELNYLVVKCIVFVI